MKKYIPYIIETIILIYIIPYVVAKTPVISGITHMVSLVFSILFLTIIAIFYGRSHRFSFLLPLINIVLLLPYAYFNDFSISRFIFTVILYAFATVVGNLTGLMFKKKK